MPKAHHAKTNTSKRPAHQPVSADNDWWSWVLIAVIFAIASAAVWGPVILAAM